MNSAIGRRKLNSVINGLISPLGVELRRRGSVPPLVSQYRNKLQEAAGEMEKLARATVFPDLPPKIGRLELMMQLMGTQLSEALHLVWHLSRAVSYTHLFHPFDTSHPGGRSKERYRRLLLTAATGPIANGCGFLAFLITVPLTVRYLGPERYGAWMSLSALMLSLIHI